MAKTVHDRYLEAEILGASPLRLVEILYRAAIESVAAARRHLQKGEIRERSRSITKASEIINHMMLSLDHARGGDVSRNLVELYAYMQTRLIEANTRQIDPPLAEVEQLLNILRDAWRSLPDAPETHAAAADAADANADYVPVSRVY